MKLFDGGKAPNPRRVRVFLAEKGIEVPIEPVDMTRLEHRGEAIVRRNPLARLPVLELDDGTILTESVAICRYFELLHPGPALFGTGAIGQARVEMWNRRLELGLLATVAAAFRHTHPAMKDWEVPQFPDWGAANRIKAVEALEMLDRHLADTRFVCGEDYTIADITGLVALDFMKPARIELPEQLAHVRRWHAEISARPSAAA
ncbi:glutathione S-transferase [Aurantimonas sp. Leaf443]|uniref:glutathione S-transferase family protein n=1 Tax=Aurantimonas sp. Leaf443 TaxID=1736378 RepID=UPI0006FAA435|nr:glutathione S-transferase [Aurantimonas sp. Leaf443]KQT86180.1 glutathione S-transferase [Aurantimonas sp. Leaf443]